MPQAEPHLGLHLERRNDDIYKTNTVNMPSDRGKPRETYRSITGELLPELGEADGMLGEFAREDGFEMDANRASGVCRDIKDFEQLNALGEGSKSLVPPCDYNV